MYQSVSGLSRRGGRGRFVIIWRMKTLLKAALWTAAALLALALLSPVLVRRYLPPRKVRALIAAQAQKSLGRQVRIGRVSYGWRGITLGDVAVSQRPDFSAGTFLSAKSLSARPAWLALLHGRLRVDSVFADGLDVRVARGQDGRFNFSDLTSPDVRKPRSGAPSAPQDAAAAAGLTLQVERAEVSDSSVHFTDAQGDDLRVSGLQARVGDFRLSGPFDAALSFAVSGRAGGRPVVGSLDAAARVDLGGADPRAFSARLSKLSIEYGGLTLQGTGRVKGLSPCRVSAKLAASSGGQEVAGASWSGTVAAEAAGARAEGDATLQTPGVSTARLSVLGLPAALPLPALSAGGRLAYGAGALALRDFSIKTPAGDVSVSGTVSGVSGPAPAVSLRVEAPALDLAQAGRLSGETGLGLAGTASLALSASGSLPRPALSGQARLAGAGAKVDGLTLSGFSGAAAFSPRQISLPDLEGRLDGEALRASVTVDGYQTRLNIRVKAAFGTLNVAPLLAARAAAPGKAGAAPAASSAAAPARPVDTSGEVTIRRLVHPDLEARNVSLSWSLTGLTPDLRELGGWAKLSSNGGRFHVAQDPSRRSEIGKVLLYPLLVVEKIGHLVGLRVLPNLSDAAYDEIKGDYAFARGLMTVNDSHLYSRAGRVKARGRIDLPAERLDMRVSAQAGALAPVDVVVKGTFEHPKTRVEAGKLLEQSAEKLLEGPAKQLVPPQARKLLEGLFK